MEQESTAAAFFQSTRPSRGADSTGQSRLSSIARISWTSRLPPSPSGSRSSPVNLGAYRGDSLRVRAVVRGRCRGAEDAVAARGRCPWIWPHLHAHDVEPSGEEGELVGPLVCAGVSESAVLIRGVEPDPVFGRLGPVPDTRYRRRWSFELEAVARTHGVSDHCRIVVASEVERVELRRRLSPRRRLSTVSGGARPDYLVGTSRSPKL